MISNLDTVAYRVCCTFDVPFAQTYMSSYHADAYVPHMRGGS